mgnify:FL=1
MTIKALTTKNLTKNYQSRSGTTCALNDINIDIDDKQIVSIMGPSGCGKSTLLQILGGINKPTSGTISFYGHEYSEGIPNEDLKKIGFVFQADNLLAWRTVKDNLYLPLEIMNLRGKEWDNRIHELLDMVGLKKFINAYPHELSGGMRQRIRLIRALVHNPNLLLMDQPFGALDAITRKLLNYEFLSLCKKTQKTILLVTNDIDEALLLSSKIYIMSSSPGKIINEVKYDLPIAERNRLTARTNKYQQLRIELKKIIQEEMMQLRVS